MLYLEVNVLFFQANKIKTIVKKIVVRYCESK